MKSLSLTALSTLAALSVVSLTSTAFAAPAAGSDAERAPSVAQSASPVLVAQATTPAVPEMQPADQPSNGSGSATAAPSDGSATTTPAVSVGTGTAPSASPPKDAPQAAAEEPQAKPKPRPFAGTQIFTQLSMTTDTVFRGQQQDWNPTVEGSMWLMPRYAINKDFQLRGRAIVSYEMTNSDSTTTKNEPVLSDTTVQLFYRSIPAVAGIKPMIGLNLGLPTSKASRYRTVVVSPGATLQLSKAFEHVLGGEVMLIGSAVYSHPIYRSETPLLSNPLPYAVNCVGGNCDTNAQLFSNMNASDSLAYALIVVGEWGKWSPALYYLGAAQWAYTPSTVDYMGQRVTAPEGFDATKTRQTTYFSAWLDYNANSWFTAEVGYWLSRTAIDANGTYGNPFYNPYNDMRVYVGANFNIDNIMQQLEGGNAEAGVVRAHNTQKRPMWNF